ncbi:MAG: type II secretion system protein [Phycisphaeraceae bacterium]|nr:type II secretion system protein [Phycisphaeraceae bacterium]
MHRNVRAEAMRGACRSRAGFTLIELSVVIVIVAIMAALVTVAVGRVVRSSRVTAEREVVRSLATAVEQFKQTFGFLPPLVDDDGAGTGFPVPDVGVRRPVVWNDAFLRYEVQPDKPRYSIFSLPFYLMGVLDTDDMSAASPKPVDGVKGPGFTRPLADGSFSQRGETFNPLFDPGTKNRLIRPGNPANRAAEAEIFMVDRWHTGASQREHAIRYYRWLPQETAAGPNAGQISQYLVPRAVGDPDKNPKLRSARFAIVSVGPDGKTDERKPLPTAGVVTPATDPNPLDSTTEDDVVEVGE